MLAKEQYAFELRFNYELYELAKTFLKFKASTFCCMNISCPFLSIYSLFEVSYCIFGVYLLYFLVHLLSIYNLCCLSFENKSFNFFFIKSVFLVPETAKFT